MMIPWLEFCTKWIHTNIKKKIDQKWKIIHIFANRNICCLIICPITFLLPTLNDDKGKPRKMFLIIVFRYFLDRQNCNSGCVWCVWCHHYPLVSTRRQFGPQPNIFCLHMSASKIKCKSIKTSKQFSYFKLDVRMNTFQILTKLLHFLSYILEILDLLKATQSLCQRFDGTGTWSRYLGTPRMIIF